MKSSNKNRFKEKVKPKDFRNTIKRLWGYFRSEKKLLSVVLLLVILDALLVIASPYLIGKAVDYIDIKNLNLLKITLIVLIVSYLIDVVVVFLQNFIIYGMSQKVVRNIRSKVFIKFQNLPISFFDKNLNGDLMSRVANDVENISSGISDSLTSLLSGVLTIIATLIIMLITSPILTLCTVISIPLVLILTKSIARRTKVLFKDQQVELGKLNAHVEEMIGGINIVKAFNYEEKSIKNFKVINDRILKISIKAQIYSAMLMPMMNVINNLSFALISVVGGILATKNIITVGVIATFLSYSRSFTRPLNNLANLFNNFQSALAGCERVFEVLDAEDEKEDNEGCKVFDKINDELVFEDVSFGYKEEEPVLKNINLRIKANTSNAIIGETGCGKTTIVNLITRFYDATEGSIKIDGTDIRDYCKESYRNSFGVVLQDSYLFNDTVAQNIKYGNFDVSDEDVINTCKKVGVHNLIMRLKNGYNTRINESGQELSQGERQLLTIARSIIKNPNILILDEATSSVDTKTELKIQETMIEIMKGRTSFIIAHRLSTIRNCDNIIVIQDGKISEMGNHNELMKLKGYYYNNINILDNERK
ncbi:ABC transporter ATP-binding protein [Romboutsia weinsteinii]|uniref:ABC transporter ATP-binding protein n=1 Tax=Romboutsia weinsteinii TaxID=2020949 RepID=A0A371J201_9FIRM|nr:ABC transporter ATP-binding protein [Romboutsia weinsteinii]RDY26696.1 ABC transporter ATP-binding protein [Romboutsia weinsteinii]